MIWYELTDPTLDLQVTVHHCCKQLENRPPIVFASGCHWPNVSIVKTNEFESYMNNFARKPSQEHAPWALILHFLIVDTEAAH